MYKNNPQTDMKNYNDLLHCTYLKKYVKMKDNQTENYKHLFI